MLKWFGDFYEAFFGALWLDCDQSPYVAWEIIRANLESFMNLDEMRDGKKYLQDLNPIRKLLAHKDTDSQTLVVVPRGKRKPAEALDNKLPVKLTKNSPFYPFFAFLVAHFGAIYGLKDGLNPSAPVDQICLFFCVLKLG